MRRFAMWGLVPLQAALLFWHLNLLSPWFDEADTLLFMRGPLRAAIVIPATGLHPPLYFILLWCWMRLPLGLAWTVQARALSVLFALAATACVIGLVERAAWPVRTRFALLALWTLSPFLLLYARMSRSYSLQLLLGTVSAAFILRFAAARTRRNFVILGALLITTLYTHYVPGFALLAATNAVLARRRRWRDAAALDALCALAFLPWMVWLIPQLETWTTHRALYSLTGNGAGEIALKLAYWAMSFTMGEAVPDALLLFGALLAPLVLALIWTAARAKRELGWLTLAAGAAGFLGVAHWVSYPFVPARMIFIYPLFLGLLVEGASVRRGIGTAALAAMVAVSLSGIWRYFHLEDFRNKQYPLPMAEIAATIRAGSPPNRAPVLIDSTNSDIVGLRYALGRGWTPLATGDPKAPGTIAQWLADPAVRAVWFLRNTHDVSPQGLDAQFEAQLGVRMRASATFYEPFTPIELRLMRALGMRDPPRYFHELLEFQR